MSLLVPNPKIINLSSRFEGWVSEIDRIIKETGRKDLYIKAAPGVPWEELSKRLKELKYVFLLDKLKFRELRRVTNCMEDLSNKLLFDLEKIFNKMKQDSDPQEVCDREDREERVDRDEDSLLLLEPCYDYIEDVIIDCLGVYVRSLTATLKKISSYKFNHRVLTLIEELEMDPGKDGPAILLCPELIESVYRNIVKKSSPELLLHPNPTYTFLKATYLHELGHHIYQTTKPYRYLWEAMANWFAYGFLNVDERYLIYKEALCLPYKYQCFNGFLVILHPLELNYLRTSNWEKSEWWKIVASGELFMQKFEKNIFRGEDPPVNEYLYDQFFNIIDRYLYDVQQRGMLESVKSSLLILADLYSTDIEVHNKLCSLIDALWKQHFAAPSKQTSWHCKIHSKHRILL